MKKSLLALAVLGAFAASAQAQTNVTIYGSFDGGIRHQTNVRDAAGNEGSRTTMGSNGTFNSNRIGFRGIEDLGGGLNAHFTLETGFNTGTGRLDVDNTLFNRTAAVGIGGAWGSLDFGRQYTVAFKTIGAYDPFSYKYPGIADAVAATAGTRYNNDVQYTGTFGPITARAEWAFGEVAGDTSAGANRAIGVSYLAGPVSVGGAYTRLESAAGLDTDHWTVGGAFKFGPARVAVGYQTQEAETATGAETEIKRAWVGGSYAITPAVELTAAYYRTRLSGTGDAEKDNYMVAATYALSKRTNVYLGFDVQRYDGAGAIIPTTLATGEDSQRAVSIGVNHLF
jgi:predicted porin